MRRRNEGWIGIVILIIALAIAIGATVVIVQSGKRAEEIREKTPPPAPLCVGGSLLVEANLDCDCAKDGTQIQLAVRRLGDVSTPTETCEGFASGVVRSAKTYEDVINNEEMIREPGEVAGECFVDRCMALFKIKNLAEGRWAAALSVPPCGTPPPAECQVDVLNDRTAQTFFEGEERPEGFVLSCADGGCGPTISPDPIPPEVDPPAVIEN